MADDASMIISGSFLPHEIQKKFSAKSFSYEPANDSEGYYYKLTNVTTASADLIDTGVNYMQFGGAAQGADTGTDMHTTAATDVVKFLYIEHTGKRDDGTTNNTADSIYVCFDAGAVTGTLGDALEIGPSESWFCKPNCTIADLHCKSATIGKGSATANKIQAIVIAIIDNV